MMQMRDLSAIALFLVSVCMKYCCDMIFVYCSAKEGGVV